MTNALTSPIVSICRLSLAAAARYRCCGPIIASDLPPTIAHHEHRRCTGQFLRHIIDTDLAHGTYATRRWAGSPGDASHHALSQP